MRRQLWSDELNVAVLPKIPGRGSVKAQPCDKVHAFWRHLADVAEDASMHVDPRCIRDSGSAFLDI